jgi:acyl-CoA synthetase (AMP-forming)/AMP-acid ligase II
MMSEKRNVWEDAWSIGVRKYFPVEKPIPEYLRDVAQRRPDHIAINFYGDEISYRTLDQLIDQCAWAMIGLGLEKGDRVALFLPNCPQYTIAFMGALRAGGVVVALNPMFKAAELDHEIRDAGAKLLVCADFLYPEVAKIRDATDLAHVVVTSLKDYLPASPLFPLPEEALTETIRFNDTLDFKILVEKASPKPVCRIDELKTQLALLQYTSGTTGLPKGAMINHHGLALACLGAQNWFSNDYHDVTLAVAPFFHIMGMIQSMCMPLISGGTLVVLSRFVPRTVLEAIQHYKCTAWVGATTMLVALLQTDGVDGYDLSSFRYVVSGGAPISVELQNRFAQLVPNAMIIEGYGLTECISQGGAVTPLGGYRPGFVGVPFLNDVKIVDPENPDVEVGFDTDGELLIRGECLMTGYWNNPEQTTRVIKDGWLHTGDIGSMDEKGYIKISGRNRDLIKCSGFSVFPAEVENLMYRHPAVGEVVVVGVPDAYRGESPKAFVVVTPEYRDKVSEAELVAWCKENMAAYKRPRKVVFLEELPKNAAGKVLRNVLVASK